MLIAGGLLAIQGFIVLFSLFGYRVFADNPDLLTRFDPEARFFVWTFYGFAILNLLAGGLAVLWEASLRNGRRAVAAFLLLYGITLGVELAGTTLGIPFGQYSYGVLLGPKWFGHVPILVPLSWYTVAWPLWVLVCRRLNGFSAVVVAALLLVAWDLVLDPAMSKMTSYWIWMRPGDYYGMPWTNLLGWAVTGVVLFAVLSRSAPEPRGSSGFATLVFIVNMALPYGFCVLQGYWLAVAGGTAGLLGVLVAGSVIRPYRIMRWARAQSGFSEPRHSGRAASRSRD